MVSCAIGRAVVVAPLIVAALAVCEALAHDIRISARVEGRQIVGKVYVRGGGAVAGAKVTAFDPHKRELASTQTDQQGLFRLPVRRHCDHRLIADAGDGHGAEYLIKASSLPEDLPAADDATDANPAHDQQLPAVEDAPSSRAGNAASQAPSTATESEASVRQLRAEIDDLRQQLDQYRQRVRLLDVLGGIGYILGLTGIAYYWLAMRRSH